MGLVAAAEEMHAAYLAATIAHGSEGLANMADEQGLGEKIGTLLEAAKRTERDMLRVEAAIADANRRREREMEALHATIRAADEHSAASRAEMRKRMETLEETSNRWGVAIDTLETAMSTIRADIAGVKAVTDSVNKMKVFGSGVLVAGGAVGTALIALIAAYWQKFVAAVVGS